MVHVSDILGNAARERELTIARLDARGRRGGSDL